MRAHISLLILCLTAVTIGCGPRNQDKLNDNDLATANGAKPGAPADRCGAASAQDEVRSQLFARAAEIRGANGDNYAKIANFAVLQVDGAVPVAAVAVSELVDCRAHATLRLPPGLHVAGGRTALGGDIGYTISPGSRGTVTLGLSDAIAIPLATLTQARATAPREPVPGTMMPAPGQLPQAAPAPPPPPPVEPSPPRPDRSPVVIAPSPPVAAHARPSFDCRRARTYGERSVCANAGLAGLDRDMAAQYRGAVANGAPQDRRLLEQTRGRFLAYRDRCSSESCIANAYRGRMREIADIVAGRWQAPN